MLVTTRLGRGLAPGVQHPFPFYLSPSGRVCLLFLVGRSELGHNDGVTVSGCQPCIWAQGARAGDPLFLSLEQPDPACDYAVNAGARRGRKRFLLGNGATNVKSSKDQTLGTYTTLLPDT